MINGKPSNKQTHCAPNNNAPVIAISRPRMCAKSEKEWPKH